MDVATRLALEELPRLESIPAAHDWAAASLACLVVDLDRFQSFNEEFGHAAGDSLLEMLFGVLGQAVPSVRWAWLGKDQFAGFLPGDARAARLEAEGLPLEIQSDQRASLRLSWGVAAQVAGGDELADVVNAAAEDLDERRQLRKA